MKTLETIFIYIIGIYDFITYWYIRIFPVVCGGFCILLFIAAENGIKQQLPITFGDIATVLAIIAILIFMSALWVIFHQKEKLENSRPPRHFRKDVEDEK